MGLIRDIRRLINRAQESPEKTKRREALQLALKRLRKRIRKLKAKRDRSKNAELRNRLTDRIDAARSQRKHGLKALKALRTGKS
ncbi:MAG: hypothetical protein ACPGOY_04500 [Rhodospirillaceae bacterium]